MPWLLCVASLALLTGYLLDSGPELPPDLDPSGPEATPAEMDHRLRAAEAVEIPAPPPADARAAGPFQPLERGPEPSALLRRMREEPERYRALIEAARRYFDLDLEQWQGRQAFMDALVKHAKEGERVLATPDALRYVVAQGRSFHPSMTDRTWQRKQGITDAKAAPRGLYQIRRESLDITFSVPKSMQHRKALVRAYPRVDPAPLLIALHDADDAKAKAPGVDLIERRYGDRDVWTSVRNDWHVLVPHARDGSYLDEDGMARPATFQVPLSVHWKHHHVDFDRFVLDGGREAFSVATGMPIFFAGIVLRGTWMLDARMAAQVRNFADVPVYVVGNERLAKALREAGHDNVTHGKADTALVQWMTDRRRVWPTTFAWRAARTDQVLAWWVNLDAANWQAPGRCLEVVVGEDPEQPNTIRIRSTSIQVLSLFLNDDIVDLDRPVRVEVNGNVEHDERVAVQTPDPKGLGRDFDFLFNREPLRIRNSMYFGWLTPARIVQIQVRPPARGRGAARVATPGEQAKARRLMRKARDLQRNGLDTKAEQVLDRILDLPENRETDRAYRMRHGRERPPSETPDAPPTAPKESEAPEEPQTPHDGFAPCPALPPPGGASDPAQPAAEPPTVTGPVEFLDRPQAPPAVDPGDPDLGAPQDAPSGLDWRWILAVGLAGLALLLVLRRR
mgnify:CR=1 FL=1